MNFHPQTDGQSKSTIETLEDMLQACVIDLKGNQDAHFPLIKFTYNNSYHANIQMALYKALYNRRCQSLIFWKEVGKRKMLGLDPTYS